MTEKLSEQPEPTPENHGMPLIRGRQTNKKAALILVSLLSLLPLSGLLLWHFIGGTKHTEQAAAEETYSVPQEDIARPTKDANGKAIGTLATASAASAITLTPEQERAAQQRIAFLEAKQKELQQRLTAPLLAFNTPVETKPAATATPTASGNANTDFMNQVSSQMPDTVQASHLNHLNQLITQGHLIHAVLESAINSDLPGYIRAEVREPVYAEDGSQVLIPPGSRLIGQYRSGMTQGQARIFVVWTRVITPNGISVNVASPGVDNLGEAGFAADHIDRHFFQQFGTAILLSIISAGASNIDVGNGTQYNAAQAYRVAMANSFSDTASQSLKQTGFIPPTLRIDQGRPIMVFVAHDLDFQQALQQSAPKLNVF